MCIWILLMVEWFTQIVLMNMNLLIVEETTIDVNISYPSRLCKICDLFEYSLSDQLAIVNFK